MRVVGTVIVPPNPFQVTGLGEGAALAPPGFARIDPGEARRPGGPPFLVRFAPGVSRDAGLAAIAHDIKGLPNPFVAAAERPANVVSLASIAGLPVALSGLLALIAAGTEQLSRPVDQDRLGCFGLGPLAGALDDFAVDEGRSGADQGDEVGRIDGAPAVLC